MKRKLRQLGLVRVIGTLASLAVIFGATTYALTATNTMSGGGSAGQGSSAISGYTVGAPTYTLLSTDPTKISSFSFSVSPVVAGTTVKASLVPGTFIGCTLGTITASSATATCSYASASEPTVASATTLNVVAAN